MAPSDPETELQQLASLASEDLAELQFYACAWCQHPIHRPGCDAIYWNVPQGRARNRVVAHPVLPLGFPLRPFGSTIQGNHRQRPRASIRPWASGDRNKRLRERLELAGE